MTDLTPAQAVILSDLVNGETIKEIAWRRHIKRRTVSQHITDARARLGASTRDQMIAFFVTIYSVSPGIVKEKSYQSTRLAE